MQLSTFSIYVQEYLIRFVHFQVLLTPQSLDLLTCKHSQTVPDKTSLGHHI